MVSGFPAHFCPVTLMLSFRIRLAIPAFGEPISFVWLRMDSLLGRLCLSLEPGGEFPFCCLKVWSAAEEDEDWVVSAHDDVKGDGVFVNDEGSDCEVGTHLASEVLLLTSFLVNGGEADFTGKSLETALETALSSLCAVLLLVRVVPDLPSSEGQPLLALSC